MEQILSPRLFAPFALKIQPVALIPVKHLYAAHQAIHGSRLEVFSNAGHFPYLDSPSQPRAPMRCEKAPS
jgi:pimeloyl-ACP methyl ester carboxylesterase